MIMPQVKFDWTLNIGHMAGIAILIITIVTGWVNLTNKVTTIDVRTEYLADAIVEVKTNQVANRVEAKSELQQLRVDILNNENRRQREADRVYMPPAALPAPPIASKPSRPARLYIPPTEVSH